MSDLVSDLLRQTFKRRLRVLGEVRGHVQVDVGRELVLELAGFARDDSQLRFSMLLDLTALDHALAGEAELRLPPERSRFELLYLLLSPTTGRRLTLRVPIPGDDPWAPSLTGVFKGAAWPEREVFDLFGISFREHPDLRRLLLDERFEGHPLRKDYPLRRRQELLALREVSDATPTQRDAPAHLSTPPY